jgi:peptidoglycan/xylan/chitin deacetylase (PgdA/CDA1 family)
MTTDQIIRVLTRCRRAIRRCANGCLPAGRRRFEDYSSTGAAASRAVVVSPVFALAHVFHALPILAFILSFLAAAGPAVADAEPPACPGNPDALQTSRVITVDPAATPRVGRKHFPGTLPLEDKEVVLTFDDGPHPSTTAAVLDALKHECVLATFFLVGQNAAAHPDLVKRELTDGHTVAHHSFSHPLLDHMGPDGAEAEIDRGFAAVDKVLYGSAAGPPKTPFFRFPGFASTPQLLDRLTSRHIVVFGADLWASDWNPMSPDQELSLVLRRLDEAHGGIILFHDTKRQTAAMLPAFLRSLKAQGYRVVHVIAPGS